MSHPQQPSASAPYFGGQRYPPQNGQYAPQYPPSTSQPYPGTQQRYYPSTSPRPSYPSQSTQSTHPAHPDHPAYPAYPAYPQPSNGSTSPSRRPVNSPYSPRFTSQPGYNYAPAQPYQQTRVLQFATQPSPTNPVNTTNPTTPRVRRPTTTAPTNDTNAHNPANETTSATQNVVPRLVLPSSFRRPITLDRTDDIVKVFEKLNTMSSMFHSLIEELHRAGMVEFVETKPTED
eukprot:GILJ01011890.1.p4 GENE.GILJ01011890.1~~GILJ01011890.1.p4  ORF type:complete len:232 (+),score=18.12 GILJ01011890.1:2394-3089(+)